MMALDRDIDDLNEYEVGDCRNQDGVAALTHRNSEPDANIPE